MSRGQQIIVSANPQGFFDEGTITDTSLPGMIVQMIAATFVGGRPSFRAANLGTAGGVGAKAVLLADRLQGKLPTDAYVANTRCQVYYPRAGDELNMLVGDTAGTANSVTQGDLLMIDNNSGVLKALSGNPAGPIYQAMETVSQFSASTLVWCKLINE